VLFSFVYRLQNKLLARPTTHVAHVYERHQDSMAPVVLDGIRRRKNAESAAEQRAEGKELT
jgi:hypothetical protein